MNESKDQTEIDQQNELGDTVKPLFLDEESDDEEPVQGFDFSLESSYNTLKTTLRKESTEPEPFRFYEFGLHPVGFTDLLRSIKTMRHVNQATNSPTRAQTAPSPSKSSLRKSRTFDIRAYQKSIDLQKSLPSSSKQYRISAFRPKTAKWDGSFTPNPELLKEMYRIPCRDPTGKLIWNLTRDEGKLPKGQKSWKPGDCPNDLPAPTFEQCSPSFQRQALLHLIQAVQRIEEQYRTMPDKTQEQSTLRANVGADLNNLRMERDRLIEKISAHPELLEHHKDLLEIIKNQAANSAKKGGSHH